MEEFSWSCLKKTSALQLLKWFSFVFSTGFIILPITIFLKQKLKLVLHGFRNIESISNFIPFYNMHADNSNEEYPKLMQK